MNKKQKIRLIGFYLVGILYIISVFSSRDMPAQSLFQGTAIMFAVVLIGLPVGVLYKKLSLID